MHCHLTATRDFAGRVNLGILVTHRLHLQLLQLGYLFGSAWEDKTFTPPAQAARTAVRALPQSLSCTEDRITELRPVAEAVPRLVAPDSGGLHGAQEPTNSDPQSLGRLRLLICNFNQNKSTLGRRLTIKSIVPLNRKGRS